MGKLIDKVKDTLMGAKDTVVGTDDQDHKRDTISDTLTEYESKEPMAPAKIQEHEPTAVKREMTEITEPGQEGTSPQDAAERARRSGMTKGTAGAAQTRSEYE
jgi:hypothetical protein